jgi:DNA-binding transcriptional ArsR family regulator
MPNVAVPEVTIGKNGNSKHSLKMDFTALKRAASVLRALNHKLRQQMLMLMSENGRLTVTQIYIRLRIEQSVASQHLAILRAAGVVKTERDGKFIYYTVNAARLDELASIVEQVAK